MKLHKFLKRTCVYAMNKQDTSRTYIEMKNRKKKRKTSPSDMLVYIKPCKSREEKRREKLR